MVDGTLFDWRNEPLYPRKAHNALDLILASARNLVLTCSYFHDTALEDPPWPLRGHVPSEGKRI